MQLPAKPRFGKSWKSEGRTGGEGFEELRCFISFGWRVAAPQGSELWKGGSDTRQPQVPNPNPASPSSQQGHPGWEAQQQEAGGGEKGERNQLPWPHGWHQGTACFAHPEQLVLS